MPEVQLRTSVIIPAYRAAGSIRAAIDSVLAQTRPVEEIIVIDDGGDPDLAAAMHGYPSIVQYVVVPHGGASAARNAGIRMAKGDLVAFLDADDQWLPWKISAQVEAFERWPDLGLTCCTIMTRVPGRADKHIIPHRLVSTGVPARLSAHDALSAATEIGLSTVVVKKRVLPDPAFDNTLTTAEDRDLYVHILLRHQMLAFNEPGTIYAVREDSLSRRERDRTGADSLRVLEKHRSAIPLSTYRFWKAYLLFEWALSVSDASRSLQLLLRSIRAWPMPRSRRYSLLMGGRLQWVGILVWSAAKNTFNRNQRRGIPPR